MNRKIEKVIEKRTLIILYINNIRHEISHGYFDSYCPKLIKNVLNLKLSYSKFARDLKST